MATLFSSSLDRVKGQLQSRLKYLSDLACHIHHPQTTQMTQPSYHSSMRWLHRSTDCVHKVIMGRLLKEPLAQARGLILNNIQSYLETGQET